MTPALVCIISLFSLISISAQHNKEYNLRSILFYNVENLFDTIDDPKTLDDSRTPAGRDRWTSTRYAIKLDRIAEVLSRFGLKGQHKGADIIGLCEIENQGVLKDLTQHPRLIHHNYGIIHNDSPDIRGIDVGLIYKKSRFQPTSFNSHHLTLFNEEEDVEYTRDQLVVAGLLDSAELFIIVNHWPSRRGGEKRSRSFRISAGRLTRRIIDSIKVVAINPRIVIMGDFNDNPLDRSLKKVLKTSGKENHIEPYNFFNPMEALYLKGIGSLAYRDEWSLFDQILISKNLVKANEGVYKYWQAGVYNPDYLITPRGRFKGYPFRTYAAGIYQGGYSDHFPVYLLLIKNKR